MVFKIENNLFLNSKKYTDIDKLINFIVDRRYDICLDDDIILESEWAENLRKKNAEIIDESFTRSIQNSLKPDIIITENINDISNNYIKIEDALIILNQKVEIYVENSYYDSQFIKCLFKLFKRKSKKAQLHLDNRWIEFKNCGGKNDVINQINHNLETFDKCNLPNNFYMKAIVILDSDKISKDDYDENKLKTISTIDNFCKENKILIHILEKREMENYIPLKILENYSTNLDIKELERIRSLSPTERDYYDFEKLSSSDFKTKKKIPEMFSNDKEITQDLLIDNCSHQDNPMELQTIIEKINSIL